MQVHDLGVTFPGENGGLEALDGVSFALCPAGVRLRAGAFGQRQKHPAARPGRAAARPPPARLLFCRRAERPRIGLVFQQANLMPWRTVLRKHHPAAGAAGRAGGGGRSHGRRSWIELVGLQGFEKTWPRDLSGGMAQRVAIARALIQDPDLLLLDEPFGSLDALTRERMAAELLRLWQARRKTVVMVTHSISEALLLSDRVLVFTPRPGRVVLDLPVNLPRPREEDVRYTPEFAALAGTLRKAIG